MSEMHDPNLNDEALDEEDKREAFDEDMEWWILASST